MPRGRSGVCLFRSSPLHWTGWLAASDVVTIYLVLSERTRGLIDGEQLRLMKPHAWLINTSRGPICNEGVLARACEERWIAGAPLNVFGDEPLPSGHQFRTLPNVLATPTSGTSPTVRITRGSPMSSRTSRHSSMAHPFGC